MPTLTLVLGTKSFPPVVAVRSEMQPQPVLAADDGRGQIHASEPEWANREKAEIFKIGRQSNQDLPVILTPQFCSLAKIHGPHTIKLIEDHYNGKEMTGSGSKASKKHGIA